MSERFFISDLHLGHANILRYDNRPFHTVEENDEAIIERWNGKVKKEDTVYILGDVSWHSNEKTIELLGRLNGHKNLIIGNHDSKALNSSSVRNKFENGYHYFEVPAPGGSGIVLCHYPIPCFKNHYYGWYHFYGHVHTGFEHNMMLSVKNDMEALYDMPCNMWNVGCMMPYMDYTPRSFEEIVQNIK